MTKQNWTAADLREINESSDPLVATAKILKRKTVAGERETSAEKMRPWVSKFAASMVKRGFAKEVVALYLPLYDVKTGEVGVIVLTKATDSSLKNAARPQFKDFLSAGVRQCRVVGKPATEQPFRESGTGSALIQEITGKKASTVTAGSAAVWLAGDASDPDAASKWEIKKAAGGWRKATTVIGEVREIARARAAASASR